MTIRIQNHKPATLYATPFDVLPNINASKPIDEYQEGIEKHIRKNYVEPMFEPLNNNNPVLIQDINGTNTKDIDIDMLQNSIDHLWSSDVLELELQEQVNEIYRQGIQYHTVNDWYFEEQLGIEALTKSKLPTPSQKNGKVVQYTPAVDIIPAAKQLLTQNDEINATAWFANMVGYIHNRPFNNYLLLTIESSIEFDNFKQHLKNFVQLWQAQAPLSQNVHKTLGDFDKVSLLDNLSTGLFLPNGGLSSTEEQKSLSFSRILIYTLSQYEKANPGKITVQPTNLEQLYFPENVIILNLENYAHAKPADIKKDWDALERAFNAKKTLNLVSNKKLLTAEAVDRNITAPNKAVTENDKGKPAQRSKVKRLSGTPITAKNMLLMMKHVIESQITTKITENTYKIQKTSYMRPNRRHPDDINMPGQLKTTKYRPDIHIYLDTSGSISEKQYRDSITNLILLAKSIDCNLYFSSFSHVISETTLLKTKDQSIKNIYAQFLKTPKVAGGTDFEQVWKKIDVLDNNNRKTNKSHQINFVITDFGYNVRSGKRWAREQASLQHTFYVPISVDTDTWKYILEYGNDFIKSMAKAGDYTIRRRMLM